MATLFPALGSLPRRATPGERRLAQRLVEKLEDDYLCWYNVPLGPRQRHPDFILLHPCRGLLVLEVKDWKRGQIQRIDRSSVSLLSDRGLKEKPNPLEQARAYATTVVDLLEKDPLLRSKRAGTRASSSSPGAMAWCSRTSAARPSTRRIWAR